MSKKSRNSNLPRKTPYQKYNGDKHEYSGPGHDPEYARQWVIRALETLKGFRLVGNALYDRDGALIVYKPTNQQLVELLREGETT